MKYSSIQSRGKLMSKFRNTAAIRWSGLSRFATVASILGLIAPTALAQDDEAIEEIVVTGYKASILAAREAKRMNDAISDSIMAEDIGKSTDENIADALSRVTGISLQSQDGLGQTVTVRGLNPNLNVVSLNGVQLGSGSDGSDRDHRRILCGAFATEHSPGGRPEPGC